ncbi:MULTISPECIES: gamma-glutamyl-gamma-aminobutyrate hydrolase family protein [unclassified Nocardioides]|uniref:gamma-glutamyl-gamma-aminobutyrate hydrolase family protein n=1 Tax=unclassified Nocardioides TaxID=2615069 RepID=UPI00114E50F3|nr:MULTISPECIES: gamma-glutamyl-gamma-aminobutyrate hydrolase family protein [unclassified Nocardioides]TQK69962.1 putative glutamine amidotransferase [Nocardioides sp. SLBN-35]WGY00801.1 gamma-glutamyl-gamma-aminobutyrate hydrolase family protein [Nocardioides sp. QY071]
MSRRPLIAVPARFSESASALRYRADVTARALAEAVYAAGGEPLVVHPVAPGAQVDDAEVAARLWYADGVLLPGGGDLAARWAGQEAHSTEYDVDEEQDAFDLAVARHALGTGLPLLAICRGNQVVNVALGGDLIQDLGERTHRHVVHEIAVEPDSLLAGIVGTSPSISCYHHQGIGRPGAGLRAVAESADGVIEAVELAGAQGWYLGIQWHPEDTAATDPAQAGLFRALVDAARDRALVQGRP